MCDLIEGQLQPNYLGDSDGCFDPVVLDEGHLVKSLHAKGSMSVSWLPSQKYVFVIATPMQNGIEDLEGYMPFFEPKEGESWWSEKSLRELQFDEDRDIYNLADDYPAAKLQFTRKAVQEWIFLVRVSQCFYPAANAK